MRLFAIDKEICGWSFTLNLSSLCWLVFMLAVGARLGWSALDIAQRLLFGAR